VQRDIRLARLLHVLIHMHLRGGTTTSETIALMLHTNPVLVRRTMAALRQAGYVHSVPGPGGGWALSCELDQLTARDIYIAIEHRGLFAIGLAEDNLSCPVESAVNRVLDNAMASAEAAWLSSLEEVRLSEISKSI
jgi:DNA-binding IscR family transcriptional regulator